ncbi:hypothetical protein [Spiroplasma mirum]|nr:MULTISPECIES: hypothetical protein [Spiroplasma]
MKILSQLNASFLGNFLESLLTAVVIYFALVYGHILTGNKTKQWH